MKTLNLKAGCNVLNRDVNRPVAVVGVIILGVLGSIVFLLLPMLIGAFTEKLMLSTAQVGTLGSADMLGMFVARSLSENREPTAKKPFWPIFLLIFVEYE